MQYFRKLLVIAAVLLQLTHVIVSYADGIDSLMLSDAEIQKLKKYFPEEDKSHQFWKGDPITIQLPISAEKRIVFPGPVTVDLKGALNTSQLKIINNDKSLYLTAMTSFSKTRIFITVQDTGKVLLLDLVTSEKASNTPQFIEFKTDAKKTSTETVSTEVSASTAEPNEQSEAKSDPENYVDLIRFAWKQAYAPERLLKDLPSYSRAAMHTRPFVSDLVYGDKVIAHPESSWLISNLFVTIVTLQNKYSHATKLDIKRDVCGAWLAAVVYPRSRLTPSKNNNSDRTTLFLISRRSFGETLGVCHGNA